MLEVKKDRLKEIDKQIKKAYKTKCAINIKPLLDEKKDLEKQIQKIQEARNGR
jgi:alanyl-tRNA synthetase